MPREEAVKEEENPRIPEKLSRQAYDENWLKSLTNATRDSLKIKELIIMTDDSNPRQPQ